MINRRQGRFSPTLRKWWWDAAQRGLRPTGWSWQEVSGGPQSLSAQPPHAGCGTVPAWGITLIFCAWGMRKMFSLCSQGPWNCFLSPSPMKWQMASLPRQTTDQVALQERRGFYSRLTFPRGELCRTDQPHLTQWWQSACSMAGKKTCCFPLAAAAPNI